MICGINCLPRSFLVNKNLSRFLLRFLHERQFGLKLRRGVFSQKEISLPYRQIQDIDIARTVAHRIFGVSRLVMITAGHESPEAHDQTDTAFDPIDKALAEEVRAFLERKIGVQIIEGTVQADTEEKTEEKKEEGIARSSGNLYNQKTMNTKRLFFWAVFVVVLGLIVWGLSVAMNRSATPSNLAAPAPVTSADHTIGPANAPVTLIEYGDFQCPACGLYAPVVEQLIAADSTTTLRLVFRHFPLDETLSNGSVQHPNADIAAYASEAAAMQGKFWDMYKLLYGNQGDWVGLADPHLIFDGYARTIGLDMIKFKADIDSAAVKAVVLADKTEGLKIGIDQTPTFFVNGKAIVNPQGYEAFKAIIDSAVR